MSRQYLNDKWCVRCGRKEATPYLRKWFKLFPRTGRVLDIGCGNGRNSHFMLKNGYRVDSIDMVDDYGTKIILGHDPLPKKKYGIVLANYVLMFLDSSERKRVMKQVDSCSKTGTIFMVELYKAKDAYDCDIDEVVGYFSGRGWVKIRKTVDKCILRKEI